MRAVITLIIILNSFCLLGQSVFFFESKVIDFKVPRNSESYESRFIRITQNDTVIRKNEFSISLHWQPVNEKEIIGCNGWTCGKLNIITGEFDTLYHNRNQWIVEFTFNDNYCYLVSTPNEHERFEKAEILKVNLKNSKIEHIRTLEKYKIKSLYCSNNYLTFLDYEYDETENWSKSILTLYNLNTNEVIKIDSADSRDNEGFYGVDDRSVMCWKTESELYYFKKEKGNSNGSIFKFNVENFDKKKEFYLPYDRMKSFALYGNDLLILKKGKLILLDKHGNERILYQVEYKYDFIYKQFYVIE